MGVKVELPDRQYWKAQIKCQAECPVHTDARGYVRAIAEGQDELAYLIARGPNPLASICGRVCGAPCETACRRGDYDKPIAIRALKRYVCDQFGPDLRRADAASFVSYLRDAAARQRPQTCADQDELLLLLRALMRGDCPPAQGKSVGVIGSGPAGLAAAHDLALLGFAVTIYEMEPVLAGMLTTGIPEYRLPRELVRSEVDVILAMGVVAQTNCRVGRDVTLPELRSRHDAVIIAVGAKGSRRLAMPGVDAEGVWGGVEFLRNVSLGERVDLGDRVVVIGGGNVAYDVGRTVLRQTSIDAARTAMRRPGVREVHLCSLESLEEMPADDIEIIEGDEEGIIRRNSLGPKAILTDDRGRVRGVQFQRCLRVFDEQRRFNPLFDESETTEIPCDTVLLAIGQAFDLSFVDSERDGLRMRPNGLIECDPLSGRTAADDVYVAGDLAYGPKLLIHAIASGKAVARAIYESVTGRRLSAEALELHFPVPDYERERDYEKIKRCHPHTAPVADRLTAQHVPVESGFAEGEARREASRCLNCGVNTIFDGVKCVLCGGCVDVCPESCLDIVRASDLRDGDELQGLLIDLLGEFPLDEASAIVKDETRCIRCALCAERCPTGAITMEAFQFEERSLCQVD